VRGKILEKEGVGYFPTFHPAAALYRREVLDVIQADFQTLQQIIKVMVKT
jgi:uracil-DNA glycosylase